MNPTVLVPNILLTTNPDLAYQFSDPAKQYTSLSTFLQDAKGSFGNDQFILLTTDNTEITRFEFSILGTNADGGSPKCVIEFIDSGKSFELEYFASLKKRVMATNGKKENLKGIFYIAFGVGDNLSYWSSFNSVILIGAQIFQNFNQPKTIQLTFAIGAGYHNLFDSLSSDLIDDDILTKIDFKTGPIKGKVYGPSVLTELALTNEDDAFNKNSDLLVKYLLGYNAGDFLLKETLNSFIRKTFNQEANVFIVSDDLINLSLYRNSIDNGGSEAPEGNWLLDDTINILSKYTDLGFGRKYSDNVSAPAGKYRLFTDILKQVVKKNLSIELSTGGITLNADSRIPFELEESDDDDDSAISAKEVKDNLLKLLKSIKLGLESLFPGKTKTPCTLVRESDKIVISNFVNLFSEKAKKVLGLSEELPIIFLGNQKLIRAILYGESFREKLSPNVTNNTYPINEKSFAYLNASWKSRDLYGSHPKEGEVKSLETLLNESLKKDLKLEASAYDNFPIFRYNMFNANVLSVSVTENNAFLALIKAGTTETQRRYDEFAKYTNDVAELTEGLNNVESKIKDQEDKARAKAKDNTRILYSIFREQLEELVADRYGTGGSSEYSKYEEFAFGGGQPSSVQAGPINPAKPLGPALQQAGSDIKDIAKELIDKDKLSFLLTKLAVEDGLSNVNRINYNTDFKLGKGEDRQDYIFSLRDINLSQLGLSPTPLNIKQQARKNKIDANLAVFMGDNGTIDGEKAPFKGVDETKLKLLYYTLLETLALAKLDETEDKSQLPPYVNKILKIIDLNAAVGNYENYLPTNHQFLKNEAGAYREGLQENIPKLKGAENSLETTKLYDDLLQLVDKIPMTVEIKTLPFFAISNFFWLGYPCIFYARRPKLLGNTEDYAIDYLLCGSYKILGMKHEISGDTCESSFVLQKQTNVNPPDEEDKTENT